MKVEELKDKLKELEKDETCIDVSLDAMKYRGMSSKGYLFGFEGRDLNFEGKELGIFSQELDVNLPFIKKCSDTLRESVFNEFISKNKKPLRLLTRGSNVSGLLPSNTPYIRSSALVEAVEGNMDTSLGVNVQIFDGTKCFDFISKTNAYPTKHVGDVTHCGISLVEERKNRLAPYELSVGGYLYTLSCSNGAVTRSDDLHRLGGQTPDEILERVGAETRRVFEIASTSDLNQFIHLDEVPVPNPATFVHRIARDFRIPGALEDRILDRLPERGMEPTMYDIIWLITNIANEEGISPRHARLLRSAGGRLTISSEHRCPNCKGILN